MEVVTFAGWRDSLGSTDDRKGSLRCTATFVTGVCTIIYFSVSNEMRKRKKSKSKTVKGKMLYFL